MSNQPDQPFMLDKVDFPDSMLGGTREYNLNKNEDHTRRVSLHSLLGTCLLTCLHLAPNVTFSSVGRRRGRAAR